MVDNILNRSYQTISYGPKHRLYILDIEHLIPRIIGHKDKRYSTVDIYDASDEEDKRYENEYNKVSTQRHLRSFSVPDISAKLDSNSITRHSKYGDIIEDYKEVISLQSEEEDEEIKKIMACKDEYPSLGQKERELELYETVPTQLWKRKSITNEQNNAWKL